MAWGVPRTWTNTEIVTQTMMNTDVRDNMRELWHEVAYVEFTADVTAINATHVEGSPIDVVSSGAITYVANPIIVEFYAYSTDGNANLNLWDAATDLGRLGQGELQSPVYATRRLTPTAASHTYKVVAWATGANGVVSAGAGGVGTKVPGYIRIMQKGGA
jgi:hypothetical protein